MDKGNSKSTNSKKSGAGAASQRTVRPAGTKRSEHQDASYAPTPDTVAEAAMEMLRLALEYELITGPNGMAVQEERDGQRTVWYILGTREVLRRLVTDILKYRDKRWDRVRQVRAAQVALKIREFTKAKEQERAAGRARRKGEGVEQLKRDLAAHIEKEFVLADLHLDQAQCNTLVEAAVKKLPGTKDGRLRLILDAMVEAKITSASFRKTQSLMSALKGQEQAQGALRFPKEAGLMYGYDPLSPFHLLDYVVRHVGQGFSGPTANMFNKIWDEKTRRALVAKWLRELADRLAEPQGQPTDP